MFKAVLVLGALTTLVSTAAQASPMLRAEDLQPPSVTELTANPPSEMNQVLALTVPTLTCDTCRELLQQRHVEQSNITATAAGKKRH